jgi:hypothetical protein
MKQKTKVGSHWDFTCYNSEGNLKWKEEYDNLVVNEGLNDLLQKYFNGSSYTAAWKIGLKATGTVSAGDTQASHGFTEITAYSTAGGATSAGLRPTAVLASASSQSVVTSTAAVFSVIASASVAGGFLTTGTTVAGDGGVLYGAGDFTAIRTVINGDVINVSLTLTASAS